MSIITFPKITGITIFPDQSGHSGEFLTTDGNSLSWAAASGGGTPGGSDTQIQFNDGGVFGGDSNLVWNKTTDALGIQVTPLNPIHAAAISGTTINNVVTGSVTQTAQSAAPAVTGSVTAVAEFAGPSSPNVSQNTSGSGYSASGQAIDYNIYAMIFNGSTYYRSANFSSVTFTDSLNDSSSFSVFLSWVDVTDATHYLIEKQINGGGFNDSTIVASTSYEDFGWSGTESYTSWPTEYTLATGPTAFTGASAQYVNQGSGGVFEVSTTILMEVDSIKNINGTDYVSGSPTSSSFDDTGLGQYDAQINWTDNGGATNAVARFSQNGGSTWFYQFVGSTSGPYTFTSASSDSAAEAIWGQAFSGSTTYDFNVYGKDVTPSGSLYYSTSAGTYGVTLSSAGNYILKHTLSGVGIQGAKITHPTSSPTHGQNVTSAGIYYDVGYTTWVSGTTVTPNTYGFTGTDQIREYKIYSINTIYGTTPLTLSTTDTGGAKYSSLSWTLPSGITTVKITRGINGAAHNVSKTVTGTSTTDDSADSTWNGNTTVSPTSIVPSTVRIDRVTTSLTDSALFKPHLELINTHTTGDRSAVLSFGVANGSTGTPTYQCHIYHGSSSGYLNIATGRLNLYNSIGASTPTVMLGSANEFNVTQGSSTHFVIRSQSNTKLFETRSDRDTIYMGFGNTTPGSDYATSVEIGRRTGSDHNLYIDTGSTSNSGNAFLIHANGSFLGGIDAAGRMFLSAASASSTTRLLIGGSTQSQIRLTAQVATGSTEGDIWNDSTNKTFAVFNNGIKQFLNGNLFAQTASATCANTTTETTISSTGQGTLTLPANFFVAGKTIKIKAMGFHSSVSNPNLTMKVKFGSTVILTTGTHAMHNDTSGLWEVEGIITCRTTGGSGTVFGQGLFQDFGTAGHGIQMVNTATVTVNTTTSQAVTVTAQWGTASASNTITCTNLILEVIA